ASRGFRGPAPASGERVTNDDWQADRIAAAPAWRRPSGAELRGLARLERDERGFPGPYGSDPARLFGGVDRVARGRNTRGLLQAAAAIPVGEARVRARFGWLSQTGRFESRFGPSRSATRRTTARLQADLPIGPRASLSGGGELLAERGESTFIRGDGSEVPVKRSVASAFAEARYDAGGRWLATAGARVERIARAALPPDPLAFPPRPLLPADVVTAVTPRLSAAWTVWSDGGGRWTRLRASAGLGIRPPDAFELAFTDNPALAPERSRSVDVGLEQALASGRVIAELTLFHNRYDDLIVAIGRSLRDASRYRSDNISNARARGAEVAVTGRGPRGLVVSAAYTRLDTAILSVDRLARVAPPPFVPGDPLPRRPRHQAWLSAAWRGARGSAFLEAGFRSSVLDVEPNLGLFGGVFRTPGYAVVNAGGAVRLPRGAEVFGRITNLFDRRYEEVLGFPAPRRAALVGVRLAATR
ncbi:MAG TPA: TonB-dependent receptor, partial [Vicinamibacterales bacterium]|nr:TonB-dependent receptor [Vicinamibacterales bacterium]